MNLAKIFFLTFLAVILLVGAWLYLEGDFEFSFSEGLCSPPEGYEEYEEAEDDYTKGYADRIRDVFHGCF